MMNLLSPRRVTSNYFIDRYEIFIHVHKSLVIFEHGDENLTPHSWIRNASTCINVSQCAERISNKIAKPLNETFTGLMCMLQGFRIFFV